ncbi:MAG: hypothetical protein M1282_18120, partial [Chloroflexi bacterium]|nr:hypothetical protein [Chloroflexota bacterium]
LEEVNGSFSTYTRPEVFVAKQRGAKGGAKSKSRSQSRAQKWVVPKVLLSGDHEKIAAWRRKQYNHLI